MDSDSTFYFGAPPTRSKVRRYSETTNRATSLRTSNKQWHATTEVTGVVGGGMARWGEGGVPNHIHFFPIISLRWGGGVHTFLPSVWRKQTQTCILCSSKLKNEEKKNGHVGRSACCVLTPGALTLLVVTRKSSKPKPLHFQQFVRSRSVVCA